MSKERPPAFQFYAKDWRDVKVRRMSLAAQGAYIAILADMWVDSNDQCSILNQHTFLARALGVSLEEFLEIWKEIQAESEPLFEEKDGRLYSIRLQREAMKQRKFSKEQRNRALLRHHKLIVPEVCRNNAGSMPEVCSSSSSSSSYKKEEEREECDEFQDPRQAITSFEIQTRWNSILGVKTCKRLDGALCERIKKLAKIHHVDWWSNLFAEVAKSQFLTGKIPGQNGKRPFRADLEWATGPVNLGKILSGKYDDGSNIDKKKERLPL